MAPKGKGKGGKNRRRGKNENYSKRELLYKEEDQEYAQITKMLGNGRVQCSCFDGEVRLGHIRGKLRKKVWMQQGDIILVALREFEDDRCDVVHKYNADEARALVQQGELPESAKINQTDTFGGDDDEEANFEFGNEDDSEEEEEGDDLDIDDI
ncbi:Tif11 protein [Martiniozyma asiatica (nom. inval.)]|nr:Tif11 protein [Martiniozyma asiatica]